MAQLIQFKRRIDSPGRPTELAAGEPATTINAGRADLFIGDGSNVFDLVSPDRQLELTGAQTITGPKTVAPVNLHITGGNDGDVLATDGDGNIGWIRNVAVSTGASEPDDPHTGDLWYHNHELKVWNGSTWEISNIHIGTTAPTNPTDGRLWYHPNTQVLAIFDDGEWHTLTGNRSAGGAMAPANPNFGDIWWSPLGPQWFNGTWVMIPLPAFAGVTAEAPITGNGTSGDPLGIDVASDSDIATGTDDTFPITSEGLRSQLGADAATLTTDAKTVVPAINELNSTIGAMQGALHLVGTYDVPANIITAAVGHPALEGQPLPQAAAANEGWYVIVHTGGTGVGHAPHVPISVGDWLVSTGVAWTHIALHQGEVAAGNVSLAAVNGQGWANVQVAIQALHTRTAPGALSIVADQVSIIGDGTTGDPLEVATVDGGTF